MLFRDRLTRWGPSGGRYVGKRWRKNRLGLLTDHAVPVCGEVELRALVPSMLSQIQQQMLEQGYAPRTINRTVHGALPAFLRDAADDAELPDDFGSKLLRRVRRIPEGRGRDRSPYTHDERDALLEAIRRGAEAWGLAFAAFLFATGMRPGEALGIRWRNICTVRRWCRIEETRGADNEVGVGKTKGSRRDIALSRAAVVSLATLSDRVDAEYVFRSKEGAPLDLHNFAARCWKPACKAAGVPVRPPYTTRHTWISQQLMAGKKVADVAQYVGSSPAVIWRDYYQWLENFRGEDWDSALETAPLQPVRKLASEGKS